MKVAILLNGNLRTIEKCSENIYNSFNHLSPDYFVSTYRNQYGYHPYIQTFLQYHDDPILEDSQVLEKFYKFNPKLVFIENVNDVNEFYSKEVGKLSPNMNNIESSYLQYLKIKKGLNLIEQFENNNNIKYDVIIKTRCDIIHKNIVGIDLSNIDNKIIISTGNIFPNDCILISSRDNMFSIIDFVINEFYHLTNPISTTNPPHGVLLAGIQNRNLEVQQHPIMDYVVRVNRDHYY